MLGAVLWTKYIRTCSVKEQAIISNQIANWENLLILKHPPRRKSPDSAETMLSIHLKTPQIFLN